MKKKNHLIIKTAINFALVLVGMLILVLFLRQMQNRASRARQYEDSMSVLDQIVTTLENNERDAADIARIFHEGNRQTLKDLTRIFTGERLETMLADREGRAAAFASLRDRSGVDYLFVMDPSGTVLLAPNEVLISRNLCDLGVITGEQLAQLTDTQSERQAVEAGTDKGVYYYYAAQLAGERYLVLGQRSDVLQLQYDALTDIGDVIGNVVIGENGFVFAVNTGDRTFAYYRHGEENLTGKDALSSGLPEKLLQDKASGLMTLSGVQYYCVCRSYGDTMIISAAMATSDLYSHNNQVVFWVAAVFMMVLVITVVYTLILRRDLLHREAEVELRHLFGTKWTANRTVSKKILPITVIGMIIIFGVTFYVQTLLALSSTMDNADETLARLEIQIDENNRTRNEIRSYYNQHYLAKARLIAFLLEEDPSVLNEDTGKVHTRYTDAGVKYVLTDDEGNPLRSVARSPLLRELCDENSLQAVYVFNEQGYTIATNDDNWYFTLSVTPGDQSYVFRDVLDGKLDEYIQDMQIDETGKQSQYIGVAFHYYTTLDENGGTLYVSANDYARQQDGTRTGNPITAHSSMLQIALDVTLMGDILGSTDISYLMEHSAIPNDGFVVAFDNSESHVLVYSPNTANIGKTAAQLGVTDSAFSDIYYGFQTMNGARYFVSYHYENGYYVAVYVPLSSLYRSRLPISLITVLVSLICLSLIQGLFLISTEKGERELQELAKEQKGKLGRSGEFVVTTPSGERHSTTPAIARWGKRQIRWEAKTPEQKLLALFRGCGVILVLYIALTLAFRNRLFAEGSIISYIITGSWNKGFNIFALSRCMLLFITLMVGVSVLNFIIRLITSIFGARTETIGHLLMSVIKYGSALVALFYSLYLFGFDSVSLLTSAGILSVIVGLGSQSLISDIIAGIFIVFEGEFRVGDIVTIGDTRGTVIEIGIRTTKIADSLQNIKIYNNSTISGVLNMTRKSSIATCTLSVAYGESIERVESVLAKEFPNIKRKLPTIIDGPFYRGVTALNSSSVDILITAMCREEDRMQLSRDLNRELFILCGKNDIDIPFPQVTVSYLDVEYDKETASRTTKRNAEKFVSEQKEAGKDLPEEPV